MFEELRHAPRFTHVDTWGRFLLGETATTRSLYEHEGDAVHFDLEGRWSRATLSGATYLRGLDGAVLERFGGPAHEDVRITDERVVHERVVAFTAQARPGAPAALSDWSVERLLAERQRFLRTYRPIGIVPPDRYRSLIIQATHGCSFNGCLFCSLYKGQRHRVVPVDELSAHVAAVKAFMGSQLAERRGIFLGEANALAMPHDAMLRAFDVLHAELPTLAHDVSSFVDAFDDYRSTAELKQLRERGLSRVFVGVESGDPSTLSTLGKPATVDNVEHLVTTLKEAGVSVGVIFMAGLGPAHVEASARLAAQLPLTTDDVIYVSPLVLDAKGPLAHALHQRGLNPQRDAIDAEAHVLRQRLAGRAKVARYDVRRWVYT